MKCQISANFSLILAHCHRRIKTLKTRTRITSLSLHIVVTHNMLVQLIRRRISLQIKLWRPKRQKIIQLKRLVARKEILFNLIRKQIMLIRMTKFSRIRSSVFRKENLVKLNSPINHPRLACHHCLKCQICLKSHKIKIAKPLTIKGDTRTLLLNNRSTYHLQLRIKMLPPLTISIINIANHKTLRVHCSIYRHNMFIHNRPSLKKGNT